LFRGNELSRSSGIKVFDRDGHGLPVGTNGDSRHVANEHKRFVPRLNGDTLPQRLAGNHLIYQHGLMNMSILTRFSRD
jgi:hypothetical protein